MMSNVLKVQGVYEKVAVMAMAQTKTAKDLAHSNLSRKPCVPITVPLALFEGPSVPIEPINTQRGDVGVSMEFEKGERRESP